MNKSPPKPAVKKKESFSRVRCDSIKYDRKKPNQDIYSYRNQIQAFVKSPSDEAQTERVEPFKRV